MKKLNSKGFTHHLLIFALLALVVGAAGFAGYRIYSAKKLDAQAKNWTTIDRWLTTGATLVACKTPVKNTSSGVYKQIKIRAWNPSRAEYSKFPDKSVSFGFTVYRNGKKVSTTTFSQLKPGTRIYKSTFAYTNSDTWGTTVGNSQAGGVSETNNSFSKIRDC